MPDSSTQLITANDPIVDATGLIYRLRRGAPSARSPLLIMLHGLGGDENAMWIFGRAIPDRFTVISPRAPIEIEPGTPYADDVEGGYSWLRPAPSPEPDRSTFAHSLKLLKTLIEEAINVYDLDRSNVIVMGFSQGAAMSYGLSLMAPELIAGVIALSGFIPEEQRPAQARRSAHALSNAVRRGRARRDASPRHGYLIIHGVDDQRVPILYAHQARDYLHSIGAAVEYHAYPIGHKVSPQGMKDIARWLHRTSDF
jgi:phospholipase/carboxylesterase